MNLSRTILKEYIRNILNEESESDVFGKYAFAMNRKEHNKVPQEPDTKKEKQALEALMYHVYNDRRMKNSEVSMLKSILSQGKYADVLKEPNVDTVYRGMNVNKKTLSKMLGTDNFDKKGEVKINFVYRPIKGASSSWSTEPGWAKAFAKANPGNYGIMLEANVSENKNRLLSGPDGFYELEGPDRYERENEVIGLGPIKISNIKWNYVSAIGEREKIESKKNIFKDSTVKMITWEIPGTDDLHNDSGPAKIVSRHGGYWSKEWWQYGNLHREDGPARVVFDPENSWYFLEWHINHNLLGRKRFDSKEEFFDAMTKAKPPEE